VIGAGSVPRGQREEAHRQELVERVRGLYRQAAGNGWAALVAAFCLVALMWRFVPAAVLLAWFAGYLLVVGVRVPLLHGYRADAGRDERPQVWARRFSAIALASGAWWGLASWLMLREEEPLATALLIAVVALSAAGSIASQSFALLPVIGYVSLALLPLVLRLLWWGDPYFLPAAFTLLAFYGFLLANARIQHRRIGEIIRLQQHNAALIADLEAQKLQAEALRGQAEQANLAKSQFLAAASHDLRQPLHALGLFTASLREATREPQQRRIVDKISASIDALESLFSELLDLSRLDAGHIRPQMQHASLDAILERLRSQYADLAESGGLALDLDGGGTSVYTDPVLLERILGNLIANAIRYTERGSVEVVALPDQDAVLVEVRDTGIGIPERDQARVFDEFFQGGNAHRDRRTGLGLGLAIVRRLASILDVAVSLESAEGKGTCFTLRVAAGDPGQIARPPAVERSGFDPLRGKSVLVIDDESEVLDGMRELLQAWGCLVLSAADAFEAAAVAREHTPDLIVADLRLRENASGIRAIASVQHTLERSVPALIITGDTAEDALVQARLWSYPLLHKPVSPLRLRAALSQLLAAGSPCPEHGDANPSAQSRPPRELQPTMQSEAQ
jgi:signal transduction histidine kinase/DNA-binding NarL/FixJ family response regulator